LTRNQPKQRTRAGTFATFDRRYEPVAMPDGGIIRPWDDAEVLAAFDSARFDLVWTLVDGDNGLHTYLVPGFATVNYVGRVLCAKPWPDSELMAPGYLY